MSAPNPNLALCVRTPWQVVLQLEVLGVRVPTRSGQVGLRPRVEPLVLAVEPGLVLARAAEGLRYIGSAGGLLRCDGRSAELLTPLAVAGQSPEQVGAALEAALSTPGSELQARAALERLQTRIVRDLRSADATRSAP